MRFIINEIEKNERYLLCILLVEILNYWKKEKNNLNLHRILQSNLKL